MNVTRKIVCVYPLRKSKAIDFVGIRCLLSLTLSFFFLEVKFFGAAFLTEVRGAEERGHVTVHKIVRSSFSRRLWSGRAARIPQTGQPRRQRLCVSVQRGAVVGAAGGKCLSNTVWFRKIKFALLPTLNVRTVAWQLEIAQGFTVWIWHYNIARGSRQLLLLLLLLVFLLFVFFFFLQHWVMTS